LEECNPQSYYMKYQFDILCWTQ